MVGVASGGRSLGVTSALGPIAPRRPEGAHAGPMSYDQPAPEAEEPTQTQAAQAAQAESNRATEPPAPDSPSPASSDPADEQQHHDAETSDDTASGGAPE